MELLTAQRAREIGQENDPEWLAKLLLERVEKMAKQGKFVYRSREHGFDKQFLLSLSECDYPQHIKNTLKILRSLGYDAEIKNEGSTILYPYLEIRW